jgi:Zn-dependent protease
MWLLAGLKFSKLFFTVGTMALSVIVYSFLFGWAYALGFVLLLLVHELGHYVAARRCGLNVGLPTFIPFVGAWIELKQQPMDARTEAYIGIAGPLVGSVGALVCYFLARQLDSTLLLALAYAGFFLNLINLVPVLPFDGGRVSAAISPKLWLLGVPVIVALFIQSWNPLFLLIALLAFPQMMAAWRGEAPAHNPDYYTVSTEVRWQYGLLYGALLIFLAMMCHDLHAELPRTRFG